MKKILALSFAGNLILLTFVGKKAFFARQDSTVPTVEVEAEASGLPPRPQPVEESARSAATEVPNGQTAETAPGVTLDPNGNAVAVPVSPATQELSKQLAVYYSGALSLVKSYDDLKKIIKDSQGRTIPDQLVLLLGTNRSPRNLDLLVKLGKDRADFPQLISETMTSLANYNSPDAKDMLLDIYHDSRTDIDHRLLAAFHLAVKHDFTEGEDFIETTAASALDLDVKRNAAYLVLKINDLRQGSR